MNYQKRVAAIARLRSVYQVPAEAGIEKPDWVPATIATVVQLGLPDRFA